MSADFIESPEGPSTVAAATIWNVLDRFGHLPLQIKHVGVTITPDDWVPWFIWDYGLEDAIPFVRDYRRVLAEGPAWQARRGTPQGIEIGIRWVQSAGVVDGPDGRHSWWKFQVGFVDPPTDLAQIQQLAGVIKLSAAAEDELFRMFSPDHDFRPVRMDMHRADGAGWYDGYSGTPRWEGGPLISFGRNATTGTDLDPSIDSSAFITSSREIRWFEGFRYDNDDTRTGRGRTLTSSIELNLNSDFAEPDDVWPDDYPALAWSADNGPWSIQQRGIRYDAPAQIPSSPDYWPDGYPVGVWAVGEEPSVIPIP